MTEPAGAPPAAAPLLTSSRKTVPPSPGSVGEAILETRSTSSGNSSPAPLIVNSRGLWLFPFGLLGEECGQRGWRRLVEWRDEAFTARDHNRCSVIQNVNEGKRAGYEPTGNGHQHTELAVYSFEQLKRQRGQAASETGDQITDDAEAEVFLGGDIVDRSSCIVAHRQAAANVHPHDREARREVKQTGDREPQTLAARSRFAAPTRLR